MQSRRGTLSTMSPATVNARRGEYEAGMGVEHERGDRLNGIITKKRVSGIGGAARRLTGGNGAASASGNGTSHATKDSDNASALHGAAPGSASRRKSSGRRSSCFNRDPRPVGEKPFNKLCIETLILFLTSRGYDHPVSPKLLAAPTGKEFAHIISFMFKQLDPNYKLVGKVEDEVPVMFKRLNYPINISKTAIQAVGSPHSWPNLLAALVWLVELLNYQKTIEAQRTADAFDDERGTRAFFQHVTETYAFFLKGDDETCQELDEALQKKTMQRDGVMNEDIEKLERENVELQDKLEAIQNEPSQLEMATTKMANLKADLEKFNNYINDLRNHRSALDKKIRERRNDVDAMEQEIISIETSNDSLRNKISSQDVNLEDVEKMLAERKVKDEQMNAVTRSKSNAEREALEAEVAVEQKLEELEMIVKQYNNLADKLQLIPPSSKRAAGVYYELKFHQRATSPSEMVSIDLRGTIKPGLLSLRERYQTRIRECGEQLVAAQEAADEAEARVASKKDENSCLENQVHDLEESYQRQNSEAEAEAARLATEADAYKAMADKIRSSVAAEVSQQNNLRREVEQERENASEMFMKEQSALNEELLAAADLLLAHKQVLQDTISNVEQAVGKIEKQHESISLPVGAES